MVIEGDRLIITPNFKKKARETSNPKRKPPKRKKS